MLYVSSRYDGFVYQVTPSGNMSVYVEGMGVATGMAFDAEQNLYVGDRSGTIFKISPNRQIFVFATLEPSIAAYHLAFGPDGYLYVTGPTTSSFDAVYRIAHDGRGGDLLPRPGPSAGAWRSTRRARLYVAASLGGRKGVVRIDPDRSAELFLSGPGIVGPGLHAVARHGRRHHQRPLPRGRRHQGAAAHLNERRNHRRRQRDADVPRASTPTRCTSPRELNELGVEVVAKCVIGDDRDRLADAGPRSRWRAPKS